MTSFGSECVCVCPGVYVPGCVYVHAFKCVLNVIQDVDLLYTKIDMQTGE